VVHVAVALSDGRVVRASRPFAFVGVARASTRELMVVTGVIAVLAVLLLTYVLSRTLVRPVVELTQAADALARGDLSVRTASDRTDELGRLARSLDHMADQLETRLGESKEEEARLRTMLNAMVEAVFVTDAQGTIVLTNRALDRLVARPPHGRTIVDVIHNADLHEAVWAAMRGETTSVELEVGADSMLIAAHVAPLPRAGGVVAVLHDVTELKRADRIRRDFVANASHELRTPLTAIRGFAETLRGGAHSDPEVAERFLDAILRHTTRLQRLVDDLLALSRSESEDQEFELGPVNVGAIAREVVAGAEAQAAQKQIRITTEGLDDLPSARANHWAMDHVLVNLMDNAVKYTPEGGQVSVRGHANDDDVVVEVTDTGPGIPEKYRQRIFQRFYRVDKGRTRDSGGTGLGLAIVKHLMQRIGGEIEVDSPTPATGDASGDQALQGTIFRVRMSRHKGKKKTDASAA
jgi:two-component system phosphate regulon sensor histidine kinase PhoR